MDLADGLSRRQLDNCEKSVAASSASRYFSIQFFASLEKWIGARNPVRIGSSCAAVTGYNFPLANRCSAWASSPCPHRHECRCHVSGEGGKKVRCRTGIISQEPEYLSGPPHSVAVALLATTKRGE